MILNVKVRSSSNDGKSSITARHLYECCPVCESKNIEYVLQADCSMHPLYNKKLPNIMRWMKCNDCTHSFTEGYYTDEALAILLEKAHDFQIMNVDTLERDRIISSDMVDKVASVLGKQKGKWLDVGFGNGALLMTCAEYGFEPVGIDLRRAPVEKIKEIGIEAHCMDFSQFKQSDRYSVISMTDVLEHIPYPKKALEIAHSLLKPHSVLFISCPNTNSLVWKVATEARLNKYWMEIEHYHNFGRTRLYSLLSEHGFRPVHYGVSKRYRIGMEIIAVKV